MRFLPALLLAFGLAAGCKDDGDDTNETDVADTDTDADTDSDTDADTDADTDSDTDTDVNEDKDEDGIPASEDCDDDDPQVGLGDSWFLDEDGDGFAGDTTEVACEQPTNGHAESLDCDDTNDAVFPDAPELCNGADDDCDGDVDLDDDDVEGLATWYLDADADGFGDAANTTEACGLPDGYVANDDDCNDGSALVNPDATELCNGVDDNCDASTDGSDSDDAATWYKDGDGDGWGLTADTVVACDQPTDYVELSGDCDDTSTAFNPGVVESDCTDPTDYNCDGATGYTDSDSDGWAACLECDDKNAAVNPDATETCNGVDDDCDASVDEADATDAKTWYADTDSDGYGNLSSTKKACNKPTGYVSNSTDCDDTRSTTNPSAPEYCNGRDDDCDTVTDEDASVDAKTWYADTDVDGYGNPSSSRKACSQPTGYVADKTDCDDARNATNPGASEVCNAIDDDCDTTIDEGVKITFYLDADTDGYGTASSTTEACTVPSGYSANDDDCDDTRATTYPGATEYCNSRDDDCDTVTDEDDAADASTWYADTDADTYGNPSSTKKACNKPTGYVSNDDDCNDSRALSNPAATEYCNTYDDDCDGTTDEDDAADAKTWYADTDADLYGNPSSSKKACNKPTGYVADNTDCNDSRALSNPGATEYCNTYDDDCDTIIDEDDAADAKTWYVDGDSDNYGKASVTKKACNKPTGYVADNTDCDDARALTNPGATEYCNTHDDDCDTVVDEADAADAKYWYPDDDLDGYGDETSGTKKCYAGSGEIDDGTDCNDANEYIYPYATEMCDGLNNNCEYSAWTSADEDGIASHESTTGVWTDKTFDLGTGMDIPSSGTLWFCDGTYAITLDAVASSDSWVKGRNGATKTIIDAFGTGPGLLVPATARLHVEGLTFKNGTGYPVSTVRYGGNIYSQGYLWLTDTVVSDGTAAHGGGVAATAGQLIVQSTDFRNNVATADGGGLYWGSGMTSGYVDDGFFSGNGAVNGAGAYVLGPIAYVQNSYFELNTATTYGGGLYLEGGSTTRKVDDTTFQSNEANYGGGAYVVGGSTAVTLDTVTASSNKALYGAGLYLDLPSGTKVTASSLTSRSNSSTTTGTGYGGGVAIVGTTGAEVMTLTTVDINNNTTATKGGGLYASAVDLTVTGGNISSNNLSATSGTMMGAGAYVEDGPADFVSLTLSGNTFTSTSTTNTRGGGAYVDTAAVTFTECTISGHTAGQGGGLYVTDTSTATTPETVILDGTNVQSNTATNGGGAYVLYGELSCLGTASISEGFFSNRVSSAGGAVYLYTSSTTNRSAFDADVCDLGTILSDNLTTTGTISDVYVGTTTYNYSNDKTFTCRSGSGCSP